MSLLALGMMSGTSLDGVDAALLRTDGVAVAEPGPALTLPYATDTRAKLRQVLGRTQPDPLIDEVAREITLLHADAVHQLIEKHGISAEDIDVIGFHGHTILHRPQARRTWQIGDGALLASQCGIDVVDDFRSADVAAGGEGAPLAPLYHQALARDFDRPVAILNIGGVANVTWIGERGIGEGGAGEGGAGTDGEGLVAFDTGPGNAMLDDWVREMCGQPFDEDGALASAGRVHEQTLARLLDHPYFAVAPPKSLDRNDFDGAMLDGLTVADGAATLVAFTVAAVARAAEFFPAPARRWLVTGGGRHNPAIMAMLGSVLGVAPLPVEQVGWNGDALEAQAFAFLAVRALKNLPLTAPSVTGSRAAVLGGTLHRRPG